MKKLIGLLIISFVVISGIIVKHKKSEQVVLRFAYASNSKVVQDSMKEFGRLLEEKTKGEVKIKYYPDSQLGGERELIEMTQTGAIDFTKVSASALESFSSIYSVFGIPYLFTGEEHFYSVMESDIINSIYKSTEKLGFVGLTYYDSGQRSFYMRNKKIESPKDLQGMKIRVMQSETAIKMIKLMGGSPIPMSSSEVYTSLQQGIIDGSENNEFAITDARHGEVVKNYSYDEHTRVPDIIIVSNQTLQLLKDSQKKALYEAAKESTEYEKRLFGKAVEDARNKSQKEFGVIFNKVSQEQREKLKKLVEPLHEEFKLKEGIKEIYNRIMNYNEINGGGK